MAQKHCIKNIYESVISELEENMITGHEGIKRWEKIHQELVSVTPEATETSATQGREDVRYKLLIKIFLKRTKT
ncbi:MAG: hypothetical protein ACP5GS_07955 [Nitrososphaeria archaeon]